MSTTLKDGFGDGSAPNPPRKTLPMADRRVTAAERALVAQVLNETARIINLRYANDPPERKRVADEIARSIWQTARDVPWLT